jgi:hypothetical protein
MLDDQKRLDQLEKQLQNAVIQNDLATLQKIIHPNFTYTDEFGTMYKCLADLQAHSSHVIIVKSISVRNREVNYFENVAVINYNELRKGTLSGEPYEANYFVSRVWKKNSKWRLLSVMLVKL